MHFSLRSLAWVVIALHPLFSHAGPVHSGSHGRRSSADVAKTTVVHGRDHAVIDHEKRRRIRDIHPGPKTILRPIDDDAFGLDKRGYGDLSRLDLKADCHMTFGAEHGDDGKAFLASMVMSPPNGEKVIMMEKFKKVVKSVTCVDSKGHITVTFNNLNDFRYAEKSWNWINSDKSKTFLMVANDNSCGPDEQRYPYRITEIYCDKKTLTATLTAKPVKWKSVATDFSVNYGHVDVSQNKRVKRALHSKDLATRSLWNFEKGGEKTWDLTAGGPGRFNIFTDILQQFPRLVIDCVDCMIRGSIQLRGNITVKHMKVEQAWFDVVPHDFYSKMQLDISYYKFDGTGPSFRMQTELAALGLGPLVIPHIFELGPKLAWEVGAMVTALGAANVSIGVETKFPNDAYWKLDLKDHDHSQSKGLEKSEINPIFNINSAQVTLGANAYNQAEVALVFNVLDVINYEAALQFKLPVINANVSAVYNEAGACRQEPGAAKYGIIAQSGIALESWFVVGRIKLFGKGEPGAADWFNRKLFGIKWPFYDLCYPFTKLPKVGPSATTKQIPTNVPRETIGATTLPKNAFDSQEQLIMPMRQFPNAKAPSEKDLLAPSLGPPKPAPTFVPITGTQPATTA